MSNSPILQVGGIVLFLAAMVAVAIKWNVPDPDSSTPVAGLSPTVTEIVVATTSTPTDTPAPIATRTPLPTFTPAPTDTPSPTDTPVPTGTPEPSPTTSLPAATPEPPTATPETVEASVSIPTPEPPAPTPVLVVTDPPILIEPQPNASQYRNRVDLEWEWAGTLGPDDYFQVEIRNRYNAFNPQIDEFVDPIDVAWVKTSYYKYDRIDEAYDREYTWRIIVVRGVPPREKDWSTPEYQVWEPSPQFERISQPSEMRTLYVEPGDEPVPGPEP
ncbi:MAG: hypothetical protein ACE5FZ_08915, partial [Nitrospiria bacterium]